MRSDYLQQGKQQHLVPLPGVLNDHKIKYLVLNEQPTEYICEHGCVHEYPRQKNITTVESRQQPWFPALITNHKKDPITPYDILSLSSNSSLMKKPHQSSKTSSNKNSKILQNKVQTSKTPSDENHSFTQTYAPYDDVAAGLKPCWSAGRDFERPQRLASKTRWQYSDDEYERKENERNQNEQNLYDKNNADVFSRLYPYKRKPNLIKDFEGLNRMDWTNYHRLSVIYEFMHDLEKTFPSLCTVGIIGKSVEGRDLKLLKISNGNAKNSAVWIDAGIHAREWIGPAVNTFVANYLARNFDHLPKSCRNKDWYFMPVVNPDGYEYSHTKCRMWRKNRQFCGKRCVGVDINRNFSVAWGGKGSSDDPNHNFFRGTAPFSEPEACALKNVLQDAKLPFKVYITLHSFGEVIIFPFAHSEDLCPDYVRLLTGATVMSRAIYDTNGTIYRVGVSKDVMYRASGTSNDWCYGAVGIPWCYLIELRSKKHKFKLPEEEIKETSQEILNCVMALVDHVDKYPTEQNSGDCRVALPTPLPTSRLQSSHSRYHRR